MDYGGATRVLPDPQHLATLLDVTQIRRLAPFGAEPALFDIPVSDRGGLHRLHRLRGVELPVALFDAASPLVPRKGHADMVWASAFACGGDLLLRRAGCQGEDLIPEGRRGALAASWCCGGSARAPT